MKMLGLVLMMLGATASDARAEFEGILEMKMSMPRGGVGKAKISISKLGTLSETEINIQGMSNTTQVLFKAKTPEIAYAIDEKNKTYNEIDLKGAKAMASEHAAEFEVKKVGSETVNGYKCEHLVISDRNGPMDVWTSKDIGSMSEFAKAFAGQTGPQSEPLLKRLRELNADGFWVKMVRKGADADSTITMELIKVEKRKLAASTFEIPSDYKKKAAGNPMMGGSGKLSPEVMEKLKERMKDLTPEQREQMLKAMKSQMQGEVAPGSSAPAGQE